EYAVKITAHFGLTPFLKTEYGAELNGTRSDKSDLLRYALKSSDIDASDAIMVGDRKHDMLAASANGITTLGVLWGYGSKDELQSAHAEYLISSPQQLNPIISDWAS
ncbi:MAG: HAD family hydrolase, partial [Dehalococcoidales bacterium]|nr:HAD family hydrolase [Dehalococcoidales bacterium]